MITIINKIFKEKRAQAAMEFLTTYGWAILILIIVVVALANLGVFRAPSTPNTCSVSAPFACVDIIIDEDASDISNGISNITFRANNVATAIITRFSVTSGSCTSGITNIELNNGAPINGDGNNFLQIVCAASAIGNRETGEIDIQYTLVGGGAAHTTTLRYSATRENGNGQ